MDKERGGLLPWQTEMLDKIFGESGRIWSNRGQTGKSEIAFKMTMWEDFGIDVNKLEKIEELE